MTDLLCHSGLRPLKELSQSLRSPLTLRLEQALILTLKAGLDCEVVTDVGPAGTVAVCVNEVGGADIDEALPT